ncbi:MAG: GNAT family N-acetyltransferase, partial [Planctomycetota bacterium]
FAWGEGDRIAAIAWFWKQLHAWARKQNVVSELIRFALFHEVRSVYPGCCETPLDNVVRNLDCDEGALWRDYEYKVRKNVKRAVQEQVTIETDGTGVRLEEFFDIYSETMTRRGAEERYYLPRSFFERLHAGLRGQYQYFHAVHAGNVVSTELVLVSEENLYSFLGGTRSQSYHLRPND